MNMSPALAARVPKALTAITASVTQTFAESFSLHYPMLGPSRTTKDVFISNTSFVMPQLPPLEDQDLIAPSPHSFRPSSGSRLSRSFLNTAAAMAMTLANRTAI